MTFVIVAKYEVWEDVSEYDSTDIFYAGKTQAEVRKEVEKDLAEYRLSEPSTAFRIVKRR